MVEVVGVEPTSGAVREAAFSPIEPDHPHLAERVGIEPTDPVSRPVSNRVP